MDFRFYLARVYIHLFLLMTVMSVLVKSAAKKSCDNRISLYNQIRELYLDPEAIASKVDELIKPLGDAFQDQKMDPLCHINIILMLFIHCRSDFRDAVSKQPFINQLHAILIENHTKYNIAAKKLAWLINVG